MERLPYNLLSTRAYTAPSHLAQDRQSAGGSNSPLFDVRFRRRSRINLASPAERSIHLKGVSITPRGGAGARTAPSSVRSHSPA